LYPCLMSDPNREPTSQPIFNFENDTNYQDMAAVLDEAVFNLLGTPYYSPGAESSSQETIELIPDETAGVPYDSIGIIYPRKSADSQWEPFLRIQLCKERPSQDVIVETDLYHCDGRYLATRSAYAIDVRTGMLHIDPDSRFESEVTDTDLEYLNKMIHQSHVRPVDFID
jgi:hypothetical protein